MRTQGFKGEQGIAQICSSVFCISHVWRERGTFSSNAIARQVQIGFSILHALAQAVEILARFL